MRGEIMPAPDAMVQAAVVGASGYVGMELARLLVLHPQARVRFFVSRAEAGKKVAESVPALDGFCDAKFCAPEDADYSECDAVFFATPPGVAMRSAGELLAQGKTVIDLSPDFRLRSADVFAKWYCEHSAPELLPRAVYGLSESARAEIAKADLIACPGCFATAVALALLPFAARGLTDGAIVVDAKSGVSGAGRRSDRADLLFAEQHGNFKAYAISGHRHQPEMEQTLAAAGGNSELIFVPHLLPAARGIYASAYFPLKENAPHPAETLAEHWRGEPFITVRADEAPQLSQVVGGNRARIGAARLGKNGALVIAALDNLIKGAAGQAVQNMNIRFGIPETAGLAAPG